MTHENNRMELSNLYGNISLNVDAEDRQCLFVFDSNYIYPFFVSLFSLSQNSPTIGKILVASDRRSLSEKYRLQVQAFCELIEKEVIFIDINLADDLPISKGFNNTTYAKLFAIGSIENKFCYFDVDTLFVNSLEDFWDSEFVLGDNHAISARTDPGISSTRSKNLSILNSQGRYFNAGVMIVDPNKWRSLGYSVMLPYALSNYVEFGFEWLDQCVFNFLVAGNYKELSPQFNRFVGEKYCDSEKTSIFHFAGSHKKPWRIPKSLFRRFLYLRLAIFAKPFREYLKYEKLMLKFLKKSNRSFYGIVVSHRNNEFARAPHLIDLLLFKYEMRRFGWLFKLLHRKLTFRRR